MKMSNLYMPTLRENPNDADIASAQLLLRAGMIRKLVSGVYAFLPMGFRVLKKIEGIVRDEMDAHGSQEVLMSAIQPREIWEASHRLENFGPEMFKLKDRNQREFCLGPTHEEYFTYMIQNELKSYKQLPLNLYQIQTKYRDERRPRFGLVRAREFIMKDAYTFDCDMNGLNRSYETMAHAYNRAFDKMALHYKVVQGDSGNMGGNISHEYIAITPTGESLIAYCHHCDYAATEEVAASRYQILPKEESILSEKRIYTPDIKTIDDLKEFLNCDGDRFIKTLLLKKEDQSRVIAACIPGHRSLNLTKLAKVIGENEDDLLMLEIDEIKNLAGSVHGFAGPIGLSSNVELIADRRIFEIANPICGANEQDYHIENVQLNQENFIISDDLLSVEAGDFCPSCGHALLLDHGTEVGNIFQLGDKYSKALNATFLDCDGKAKHFMMGSYGIGISRCVSAIVDQYQDEHGIKWPLSVAPYQVLITIVNVKNEQQYEAGFEIYNTLINQGVEVLIDDRDERAGVKFADADLIGIPFRITVGKRISEDVVEVSKRSDLIKRDMTKNEMYKWLRENGSC